MKTIQLHTFALIIVIMSPLVFNTINSIVNLDSFCELMEKESEEKKGTEEKKGKEETNDLEDYLFNGQLINRHLNTKDLAYFTTNKCFSFIDTDVLIEPPESLL